VQKPTEYRAYIARSDRQFEGFVSMLCVDDAEAIEKVKELVKGQSFELWSGAPSWSRFILSRAIPEKHNAAPAEYLG
jgi:hypothetical protein